MLIEVLTQHKLHKEGDSGKRERVALVLQYKVLGSSLLNLFRSCWCQGRLLEADIHSAQRFVGDVHDASPHDEKFVAFVDCRLS